MEPLAGSIACLLSLFLPWGQALREVWRCEMRRRLRAGVLYRGNGLAIMKGAAPLKRNIYGNRNDVIFEGYDFPTLWELSLTCMNQMMSERKYTGLGLCSHV